MLGEVEDIVVAVVRLGSEGVAFSDFTLIFEESITIDLSMWTGKLMSFGRW